MKIGELADRGGVSTKTIRYYESISLLDEPERTASGYRDYDERAVERLRFIRDAQAAGLSLTEIASVLELKDAGAGACSHTQGLLVRQIEAIDSQLNQLQTARTELVGLVERANALDPTSCTDPDRCQVISGE